MLKMLKLGKTESQLYISLMYTFTYAPGPLIAILIKRTGHRTVAILGTLYIYQDLEVSEEAGKLMGMQVKIGWSP